MNKKTQKQYCHFIFDHSMDAIFLTHPADSIVRANPAACEIPQRTEAEICEIGRDGIVDQNDPSLAPALMERFNKGKIRTELTFFRKNGTPFPVDLTSLLFQDDRGRSWTVIIARDISLAKQAEQELHDLHDEAKFKLRHDLLTGIYNRQGFIELLTREMDRSRRLNLFLCLIIMDMDHFKEVNDRHGHLTGDHILHHFAEALGARIRPMIF